MTLIRWIFRVLVGQLPARADQARLMSMRLANKYSLSGSARQVLQDLITHELRLYPTAYVFNRFDNLLELTRGPR